jgi:DNA helicase-2/ATP-dependent DNA helicase PcrA
LVDLARRAVRMLDLDVELEASAVIGGSDNLAIFLDAVAAYAETDRYASLSGFLAYLAAEDEFNDGMEVATPSETESVKLLTIHRAKGLEWNTVFVPLVSKTVFPSARGRGNWITSVSTLPAPLRGDASSLPELTEWTPTGKRAYDAECRAEAAMEERRLAYVAYTRAEERLFVSGHWWGRSQQKPRGPSEFLTATRDWLSERGVAPLVWADAPDPDDTNPHLVETDGMTWPAAATPLAGRRELAERVRAHVDGSVPESVAPDGDAEERLASIAEEIELLLAEADAAASRSQVVTLPPSVSTTAVIGLVSDHDDFARSLARPMPRQPSSAARLGTRFHAWVEAHYGHQQVLLDPTDLPGRGDVDLASDEDLHKVIEQFKSGPYGDRTPAAIEAPFSIVLGGQQVIGRIDAIFERNGAWEVVDWKTNRAATADPLQLAIYRLAWAEMNGLDLANVTGAFYYVRLGEVQPFDDLPGRDELERLVAGESVGS